VKRKARRGVHRKRRERRPLPGMMLHIDGSHHQWFQDERRHDLIAILDDATSEIFYTQLAEEETTATLMAGRPTLAGCKAIIHQHLDTALTLMIAGHRVGHYSAQGKILTPLT
jgi:hypothetical protein